MENKLLNKETVPVFKWSELYMYRIRLEDYKIVMVCGKCYQNGEVILTCNICGGKGTHNKIKRKWVVCDKPYEVEKIDRGTNGNLRYWDCDSCFFEEESKLVHFTYKDALGECNKRNKEMSV